MSQIHATIFAGVEYRRDGTVNKAEDQARMIERIEMYASQLAGGCTMQHTIGSWLHPEDRNIVREKAIRIDVLCKDEKTAKQIASYTKSTLYQYSVLLEMHKVKGEFV